MHRSNEPARALPVALKRRSKIKAPSRFQWRSRQEGREGIYALLPLTVLCWTHSYCPRHTSGGSQAGQITKNESHACRFVLGTFTGDRASYEIGHDAQVSRMHRVRATFYGLRFLLRSAMRSMRKADFGRNRDKQNDIKSIDLSTVFEIYIYIPAIPMKSLKNLFHFLFLCLLGKLLKKKRFLSLKYLTKFQDNMPNFRITESCLQE